MARTFDDAVSWMTAGTALLLGAVAGLSDAELDAPSGLPDWSRKQLTVHVAANAGALANLVRWATTGVETPMYPSQEARLAQIEEGLSLPVPKLRSWLADSAATLAAGVAGLTGEQRGFVVTTIQGRALPASEIPWLRSREVCVHALDYATGATFADLPEAFVDALVDDILVKRGMSRDDLPAGPLTDVAAWLAGRPHSLIDAPEIGPWL